MSDTLVNCGGWSTYTLILASDAREAFRIGIFGTSSSYGGSYGRVTNEALGRDLNPLGRGDGVAYVAGMIGVPFVLRQLPQAWVASGNTGNSVNNDVSMGGSVHVP